ncbi:SUKH-4 family immunity protein [Streptomyces nigrescens]|uniref:SUKH-4 family immunity protein n=1 Tax=Streptomyces nigrescens TaxID=1920 RepID=UPI0036AC958C
MPGRVPFLPPSAEPLTASRVDAAFAPAPVVRFPEEALPAGLRDSAARAFLREVGLPKQWRSYKADFVLRPEEEPAEVDESAVAGVRLPDGTLAADLLASAAPSTVRCICTAMTGRCTSPRRRRSSANRARSWWSWRPAWRSSPLSGGRAPVSERRVGPLSGGAGHDRGVRRGDGRARAGTARPGHSPGGAVEPLHLGPHRVGR